MLGIVVGLQAEARIARGLGCRVAVGGGGAVGAQTAASKLIAEGVAGLISFGLAGGLAPGLAPGSLVVAVAVIDERSTSWPTDLTLSTRLGEMAGSLLAVADIVATAEAKHSLWTATGALAADIESGAVALAASQAGLPFATLRAICDPAQRDLPHAAQTALDGAGRIRPLRLARSLMRHPGQIGALMQLGRDAALARRALLRQVERIGSLDSR